MIIPDEARRTLAILAEGKTPAAYVAEIWRLRAKEKPVLRGKRSRGQWPIMRAEMPANVMKFRKKTGAKS